MSSKANVAPTSGRYDDVAMGGHRDSICFFFFFFFWWEREGMHHAPTRLGADVEDSIRARQVGIRPLDGSALCPTP